MVLVETVFVASKELVQGRRATGLTLSLADYSLAEYSHRIDLGWLAPACLRSEAT